MTKGRENTPHIGIFGRCNAGKSTLMNFITGAPTAIVSPERGTTTDPVRKSYEVADLGPMIFIDTAGVDDQSLLGPQRAARTLHQARQADLAVIVFREWDEPEKELRALLGKEEVPVVTLYNIVPGAPAAESDIAIDLLNPAAASHEALLSLLRERVKITHAGTVKMFGDILAPGDHVVLVCPIDAGAPEGRMILPQMQALREALDSGAIAHIVQPAQLEALLSAVPEPKMIVTDSQVYKEVRTIAPAALEVTTFSILLAAAKGDYEIYLKGLEQTSRLKDGDRVLILEFCAHQISCDDIARVKIPGWLGQYTGRELRFDYITPAQPLPENLRDYALVVVCGGCMATRKQVQSRLKELRESHTPTTNFGLLIRKIR